MQLTHNWYLEIFVGALAIVSTHVTNFRWGSSQIKPLLPSCYAPKAPSPIYEFTDHLLSNVIHTNFLEMKVLTKAVFTIHVQQLTMIKKDLLDTLLLSIYVMNEGENSAKKEYCNCCSMFGFFSIFKINLGTVWVGFSQKTNFKINSNLLRFE